MWTTKAGQLATITAVLCLLTGEKESLSNFRKFKSPVTLTLSLDRVKVISGRGIPTHQIWSKSENFLWTYGWTDGRACGRTDTLDFQSIGSSPGDDLKNVCHWSTKVLFQITWKKKQGSAVTDKPARCGASQQTCCKLQRWTLSETNSRPNYSKLTTLRIKSCQFSATAPAFNLRHLYLAPLWRFSFA